MDDNYHGFFILKKEGTFGLEIKNDLYHDDANRLLIAIDLEDFYSNFNIKEFFNNTDYSYLEYVWDEKSGRGVIKNFY